jgi:transposase
VLYTFTQTCQGLGVEPWRYLRDVLERLPSHPPERLAELLPEEWAQAQRGIAEAATPAQLSEIAAPPTG